MKFSSLFSVAALALVLVFAGSAQAAVGVMPVLYNASGQPVNTSGGTLVAGNYFLTPGGQQVYYYGDGTYYNPATNMYGGSVYDPAGTAGNYNVPDSTTGSGSVGIPNTGAGGNAAATESTLALAALASVAGVAYLARSRYAEKK